MGSIPVSEGEVTHNVFPYLIEYKNGSVKRLAGTEQAPAGLDPSSRVTSKDVLLDAETGVGARIYLPHQEKQKQKLPVVVYLHGGAFLIATPAEPLYHGFCNALAQSANALLVSVDYRLAPEHPLPAAFHDAWGAIHWIASHAGGKGPDSWLNERADFHRVFLSGGQRRSHPSPLCGYQGRLPGSTQDPRTPLIHPYFWGSESVGSELRDPVRKAMVDNWWKYVCPSNKGCDDPLINPFSDGAPALDGIQIQSLLVMVAQNDILRDRGRLYYDEIVKRNVNLNAEFYETTAQDHVFFLFNPNSQQAKDLVSKLASFINLPPKSD